MKRIVSSRSNQQKRKYLEVKETLLPAVADPSKPDYDADMKARVILPLDACSALTLIIGIFCPQVEAAIPDAQETAFIANPRQLILAGRRSGEGYFSQDGHQLVFQAERSPENPFFQIFTLDFRSGDIQQVSPGMGKTTCSFFHPDGKTILFASTHHDPLALEKQKEVLQQRANGQEQRYAWDYDPTMDLFKTAADGGFKQLTDAEGYDAEGSFSPNGKWIAFCSNRHAYQSSAENAQKRLEIDPSFYGEIYLMRSDGTELRRLTQVDGYDGGPFFSPKGDRIIWRRFDEDGIQANIMTMDLDGKDVRILTEDFGMAWAPYYHPSGEYVIFTTNREGFSNFELYIVDHQGAHEPIRISFTDGFDGLPVFSPDGTQLVWTSNRYAAQPGSKDKGHLFMADWNHEAALEAIRQSPKRVRKAMALQKTSTKNTDPVPELEAVPGLDPARNQNPITGLKVQAIPLKAEIHEEDLKQHVNYLASDALEGRMTGEPGAAKAAAYLARVLKQLNVQAISHANGYYQPFTFQSGFQIQPSGSTLQWQSKPDGNHRQSAILDESFRPLPFSSNGSVEGEVVFAGYGLKVPGEGGEGYNSYQGPDVSNKVVLALRYVPESVDPARRSVLNRYAGLRYKAMVAREQGARALLVVTGPQSPNAGKLIGGGTDQSQGDSGILAASISGSLAESLLSHSGKTLSEWQEGMDTENPHEASAITLPGQRVRLSVEIERLRKEDRNVVGVIHPPRVDRNKATYVMIGAHYDHLGHGEVGGFDLEGEKHQIHNGADDNASGVALVLEVAAAFRKRVEQAPEDVSQGLIVALWSGEELGLIGSNYFADNALIPLDRIQAYLNFDMVGRLRENRLTLQGIGSSGNWKSLIERQNILAGFQLVLQEDPYLPTDTTAFYPKNIPVLSFFTGSHEEYHRPGDDPETLNWKGLKRITQLASNMTRFLTSPNDFVLPYAKVEAQASQGSRDTLRAYLGTIPNYTSEVEGVPLTGIRKDSPADKAGLQAKDVIVGLGDQSVKNIYDYTYALDAVTIGEPTQIRVIRGTETLSLPITPMARP